MRKIERYPRSARAAMLIGVASGLGARDARCGQAPAKLLGDGLLARLCSRGADLRWRVTLEASANSARSRDGAIAELCARLARETAAVIRAGAMPVVLGGDHSCAVGTWSGAAKALPARARLGLVWIDAHMDSHSPASSHSGMPHGMPLATLLGHGAQPKLVPRAGEGALAAQHVCLVGVRSYEHEEAALLAERGVKVFPMAEVAERGLDAVLDDAVRIARSGTAGYGISIDLDAIDPLDAPGVCTPAPGGISARALVEALHRHATDTALLALEVVEYNPELDQQGKTAILVEEILAAVLVTRAESAHAPGQLEREYGAHGNDALRRFAAR